MISRFPGPSENTRLFQQMIDSGMGELDNSAVVGVIESKSEGSERWFARTHQMNV